MLNIDLEIRKGILFIRLNGVIEEKTISDLNDITKMLDDNGLYYVVANMEKLDYINKKGIKCILNIYELCIKNNGKFIICSLNDKIEDHVKKKLSSYITIIDNELDVFNLIKV